MPSDQRLSDRPLFFGFLSTIAGRDDFTRRRGQFKWIPRRLLCRTASKSLHYVIIGQILGRSYCRNTFRPFCWILLRAKSCVRQLRGIAFRSSKRRMEASRISVLPNEQLTGFFYWGSIRVENSQPCGDVSLLHLYFAGTPLCGAVTKVLAPVSNNIATHRSI
jgi:hypothetical protein